MALGAEQWPAGPVALRQGPQPAPCTQTGPGEVCPVSHSPESLKKHVRVWGGVL